MFNLNLKLFECFALLLLYSFVLIYLNRIFKNFNFYLWCFLNHFNLSSISIFVYVSNFSEIDSKNFELFWKKYILIWFLNFNFALYSIWILFKVLRFIPIRICVLVSILDSNRMQIELFFCNSNSNFIYSIRIKSALLSCANSNRHSFLSVSWPRRWSKFNFLIVFSLFSLSSSSYHKFRFVATFLPLISFSHFFPEWVINQVFDHHHYHLLVVMEQQPGVYPKMPPMEPPPPYAPAGQQPPPPGFMPGAPPQGLCSLSLSRSLIFFPGRETQTL